MQYLKDPQAIYLASRQQVIEAIRPYATHPSRALIRMVHACGDPDIAPHFRASPNAEDIGAAALTQGAAILCDCTMVTQGIIRTRLPVKNRLICTLNDPETAILAQTHATTRSAAAVLRWKPFLAGSIVVIGNAPTALFQLLECLAAGAEPPALIIGMPVGFIGAAESKQALVEQANRIAYLSLLGRKGGSAIAAAALNSLVGDLDS